MACECTNTGLDIFTVPPVQTSVEHGCWVEYHPQAPVTDGSPVEFSINGDSEHYLDLANTFIHVQAKVLNADNSALKDKEDQVIPVNLFLHSLFSEVDISLNGTLVSASTNTYPFRAYLETVLNYGKDAKESQLNLAGYYNEGGPHFGVDEDDENAGYQARVNSIANSRLVDMVGRVHADIFTQGKFLLSGVDLRTRFVRSKDSFALMAKAAAGKELSKYKIKMEHMSMFVRKAKLNPSIVLAHAKALQISSAKYPIQRVVTRIYSIGANVMNFVKDSLFLSQKPQRLVIGFIESKAFNGDYGKNPFEFKHFNINSLALYSDGHQIPNKALKPDFENKIYARSYLSLFTGCGSGWKDNGLDISYEDYSNGYTLFCFDLTPSMVDGHVSEPLKSGNIRLEVTFAKPLPEPVHVIVYGEQDGLIEIDRARQVITDFAS